MVYDVTMMMTEIINCRSLLFFFLFVGSGLLMPPTFRLLCKTVLKIPMYEIKSADIVPTSEKHTRYVPYPPDKGKHHGACFITMNSPHTSVKGRERLNRGRVHVETRQSTTLRVLEKNDFTETECATFKYVLTEINVILHILTPIKTKMMYPLTLHEVSFIPVERIEFTTATTIPRVHATRLTVIR